MSAATRVLCVDDNRDVVAAVRLILDSAPSMACVGCLTSADDLAGEVRAMQSPPDVVLLDANMPGLNLLRVVEDLAATAPSIRVVVFSGSHDPDFVDRVADAGAWGFVSKSGEPAALLRAVSDVASGKAVFPTRLRNER